MRPWLAALALVLAVLVCGCGGEKGGKDRDENLDLKDMTAHLRELKVRWEPTPLVLIPRASGQSLSVCTQR